MLRRILPLPSGPALAADTEQARPASDLPLNPLTIGDTSMLQLRDLTLRRGPNLFLEGAEATIYPRQADLEEAGMAWLEAGEALESQATWTP